MSTDQAMSDVAMAAGSTRVRLYIGAVLVLCILAVAFMFGVTFIRPEADNSSLIATVLGLFTPIVAALIAGAMKENHDAMNARLTQLLALTEKASMAEGQLKGGEEAGIKMDARITANAQGLAALQIPVPAVALPAVVATTQVLKKIEANTEATAEGVKDLAEKP